MEGAMKIALILAMEARCVNLVSISNPHMTQHSVGPNLGFVIRKNKKDVSV